MLDRAIVAQILPLFSGFVFVLGTVVGSFLNVVVWRLPRGESLSHPGSHCPKCGHAIRPWENIPIVSWLALRARCSQCHLPISARYPLVELANGLLFLTLWWRLWTAAVPLASLWGYLFLGSALLAAALIDIEHFLIPDAITFSGMATAAALALAFPETHLGSGITGLPGGEQMITGALIDRLGLAGRWVMRYPRLAALCDTALGMAVGYLLLWMLLEAGRRLWGRARVRPPEPVPARITASGVRIGTAELDAAWDDLLVNRGDEFRAEATAGPASAPTGSVAPVQIRVSRTTLTIGTETQPRADMAPLDTLLSGWEYPRDVLGYGDLKLLAMVGGFLGPDATVFVLMWGAMLGCVWGVGRSVLCPASRRYPLPFGPFLAAGALLWVLFGEALARWYGAILSGAAG